MTQVIVYMAMSLDGYLADYKGQLDWLSGDGSEVVSADYYREFYDRVDKIVMGHKTYQQIKGMLASESWPFTHKETYVFSHQTRASIEGVTFVNEPVSSLINGLKTQGGGDIWVCGGANLVQQLLQEDLVDRLALTIVPLLLGDGKPLFRPLDEPMALKLISSHSYNGMTDVIYERRASGK